MNVRYRVDLTQAERNALGALLSGGKHPARKLKRAQILLAPGPATPLRRLSLKSAGRQSPRGEGHSSRFAKTYTANATSSRKNTRHAVQAPTHQSRFAIPTPAPRNSGKSTSAASTGPSYYTAAIRLRAAAYMPWAPRTFQRDDRCEPMVVMRLGIGSAWR
jgi:hypothetical protein